MNLRDDADKIRPICADLPTCTGTNRDFSVVESLVERRMIEKALRGLQGGKR